MSTTAWLLALVPVAYLLGSIPFGLLVGLSKGVDPRKAGSGNIGATNVGRLLGGKYFAIVFTLELTQDINLLLPLLCACVVAHGFTVLTMRRSILTEKISRRGFHLSREYAIDPLEVFFAREIMRSERTRMAILAALLAWMAAGFVAMFFLFHRQYLEVFRTREPLEAIVGLMALLIAWELGARDEAGNTSSAQTSFGVQLGGGCTVLPAPAGSSALPWLLLGLVGLILRRACRGRRWRREGRSAA